ncbi:probable UDP-glucose:sterol glucosyltransferase Ugt53A1 [Ustilago trichophora]|uniref:Probable UDP-glucose:sterol glucosyltransferase Ugt53A1 n=1 Tax=Ustilago trichophora TaxID=86804 RepID=A0A5C3E5B7_9BASI|nr:probable UDP-glucose:sterol glucosyltransferase Ugt53A1 [Ustilago trichophora]
MGLRPLFGSRASVTNVHDSFGTTVELVKTCESEHANPLEDHQLEAAPPVSEVPVSSHAQSTTAAEQRQQHQQERQKQGGQSLAGFLNGAALMSPKNDHSQPEDHHRDDSLDTHHRAQPAVPIVPSDDAAWKQSGNEAESSDQQESSRVRNKLGRTLKKVDAKLRSTLGVNAPPTQDEMRSPYSIGANDHLASQNNLGAAELLNDASFETLQHLSDDDDDDDDEEEEDEEDDVQGHADGDDGDDAQTVHEDDHHNSSKPDLARMEKDLETLNQTKKDAEKRRSGSMDSARPGNSVGTHAPLKISSEEKMKAIIEEFGECPSLSQPNVPEKLIIDLSGVLVKTVLIKGSIFLTNRRVCFLAYIPNANSSSEQDNGAINNAGAHGTRAPSDPNIKNPILKSGPAIIHRPGKMRPKRRVWIELRKDSFNAYTASNKLYKPLMSARLSNLYAILPVDWAQPNVIRYVEGLKYSSIEFKTQEAALDWRKELEAAAFHARNTAEKVRISIPLERVVGVDSANFMDFAKVVHVDVLVGSVNEAEMAQIVKEHHDRAERHHLVEQGRSTNHMFVSCPKNPGFKCHITQIALGLTHNRAAFIDLLREALKVPKSTHDPLGFQHVLNAVPPPLIDLEGDADAEDASPDSIDDSSDDHKRSLADKFCHAFGLPHRPEELHLVKAQLVRTLHTHGTMAIGLDYLLFWRRAVGRDLKIKVPLNDIQGVDTYRSMLWHHHGLVVHIRAHSDMFFDFMSKENRDLVLSTLKRIVQAKDDQKKDADRASVTAASDDSHATKVEGASQSGGPSKKSATQALLHNAEADVPVFEPDVLAYLPRVVNLDRNIVRDSIRISPMRIYCLTIGSRGDVQPYIALCKALKEHGHTPVIVSHPEYRGWVEGHGIEYRGVGGDPAALMKLSVEHRIFSPAFFRESIGKFRVWLDELLRECWEECQGADLLIESPSTMAGIHVAEGLGIPYFRAFTMPWTKTSAYPQAFSVPSIEMGPSYNSSSYVLFDQIMWVATSGQINRWRKHMLGIGPTDMSKLDADSVPFIYNFSPAVVPMPNDWGDRVKISGYWFLDNPESNWTPPKEMSDFLEKARKDDKKIAYIGFGSITIENAEEVSNNIMKAVREADVRAIVAKGWSGRGGSKSKKKKKQQAAKPQLQHQESHTSSHIESEDAGTEEEHEPEIEIPDDVFVVDSVPHDWLFPQIDIAMHHGGAGTTGASLRAGLVTLIKPFFGDQFFWANRVQKLGAGARVNGLSVSDLTDALKSAASDRVMVEKAQGVGEKIRSEDGVATAIEFLYKNIPLAKRRTQRHMEREATHSSSPACTPSSSVFTNPLSRFSSHGRTHSNGGSGSSTPRKDQHRSATLPPTSSSALSPNNEDSSHGFHRSASTIVESPTHESDAATSPKAEKSKSGTNSLLPSLSTLNVLPTNMAASLKEMVTLHSSTTDTTADGEEATGLTERSNTTPTVDEDETEEQKMHRLKGYKNAKAEDIRRRKLLLEKLERQKRHKETQENLTTDKT